MSHAASLTGSPGGEVGVVVAATLVGEGPAPLAAQVVKIALLGDLPCFRRVVAAVAPGAWGQAAHVNVTCKQQGRWIESRVERVLLMNAFAPSSSVAHYALGSLGPSLTRVTLIHSLCSSLTLPSTHTLTHSLSHSLILSTAHTLIHSFSHYISCSDDNAKTHTQRYTDTHYQKDTQTDTQALLSLSPFSDSIPHYR